LKLDLHAALHGSSVQLALHALSFGVQSFIMADVRTSWQCLDGLHVGPVSTGASEAATVGAPLVDEDELVPEPASRPPLDDDDELLVPAAASGTPLTGSGSEPTHAAIAVRIRVDQMSALLRMHGILAARDALTSIDCSLSHA
jgi:hypothetical protein